MGQVPDAVFIATFDESNAERLAAVVQQNLPPSYAQNTDSILPVRGGNCVIYESYLDRHTHSHLISMEETRKKQNIYYNGEIEVREHNLSIENVLSGGMYDETDLVIAVAKAHDLSLREWIVAYSGYSWGEVARGSSAAELLAYLQYEE